jgi:two-component system response regulator MprA
MPKRVLIVEDDLGLRETLRQLLELDGYDVATASDGIEGIERFEAGATSVVVLDLMMPRLDGFGFASELERRGWRETTSILVLTADGRAQDKAARLGADSWLEKPFDVLVFLERVAELSRGASSP